MLTGMITVFIFLSILIILINVSALLFKDDSEVKKLKVNKHIQMKSSLKFCVIATGEYDGYVAEPRAYEWDIAAGHAILDHAGGTVTDFNGNKILYGKKDFKNTSLILKSKNFL